MRGLDLDRCVALLLELELAGLGFQFSFVADVDKAVGSWVLHDVLILCFPLVHSGFTMGGVTSERRYLIVYRFSVEPGIRAAQVSQREVTSLIRVGPWSADGAISRDRCGIGVHHCGIGCDSKRALRLPQETILRFAEVLVG